MVTEATSNGRSDLLASSPRSPRRLRDTWLSMFAIRPAEASFRRRGFIEHTPAGGRRLEAIGEAFVAAYNRSLTASDHGALARDIDMVDPGLRGFAVEGAAMGAAVVDAALLKNTRFRAWLSRMRETQTYLVHVGAGWAMARLPWRRRAILAALDPLHRPLAYDGMGFHDTYFHTRKVVSGWRRIRTGYEGRAYDQGVGRALWFASGADAAAVVAFLNDAAVARRADLWSGVGLALCYAGGASDIDLEMVLAASGPFRAALRQGCAFAAEARRRAGIGTADSERACRQLTDLSGDQASALVRRKRDGLALSDQSDSSSYERWRIAIQDEFAAMPGRG